MAYGNFKQTFWSKYIQRELEPATILLDHCTREFEGEVKYGNKVKLVGVSKPTIGNYTGQTIGSPETVQDSSVMLEITQAKYFNFAVDDVDKAQSVPGGMEAIMSESKEALAIERDKFIAHQAVDAGTYVSTAVAITTADKAKEAIDKGLVSLRENDVKISDDVVIEIPPFVYQLMKDKYITLDTSNSEMIKSGIMGYYDGCKVRVTNLLYEATADQPVCMIRTKRAIAFASQINKVEAYRPQDLFSDAVKGLDVYGAKVVRPKEIYAFAVKKS